MTVYLLEKTRTFYGEWLLVRLKHKQVSEFPRKHTKPCHKVKHQFTLQLNECIWHCHWTLTQVSLYQIRHYLSVLKKERDDFFLSENTDRNVDSFYEIIPFLLYNWRNHNSDFDVKLWFSCILFPVHYTTLQQTINSDHVNVLHHHIS